MTNPEARTSAHAAGEPDFRTLVERGADPVVLCDPAGRIFWISSAVKRLLGHTPAEVTGRSVFDLAHPDEMGKLSDLLFQVGQTPGARLTGHARFRNTEGGWHGIEVVGVNLLADAGVRAILLSLRDVTDRELADEALRQSEEGYRNLIEQAVDGVFVSGPDGRFTEVNHSGCALLGLPRSRILGMSLRDLLPPEDLSAQPMSVEDLRAGDSLVVEQPLGTEDGRLLTVEIHAKRLSDGRIQTFVRDVTSHREALTALERERRRTEEARNEETMRATARRLTYEESRDTLTGLSNRPDFELRLEQALELAQRGREEHALCLVGLDRLQLVNDACGPGAGDELLRQVAGLLQKRVRAGDAVARLSGDTFGLILRNCPAGKAREIAETLCRAVETLRFTWQDETLELGASFGLVPVTEESGSVTDLLGAAGAARRLAKDSPA